MANGWERAGAALAHNSTDAFTTGALRGAQTEEALARARTGRLKVMGIEQAAQRAYEAGNSDLGDAMMRGETYDSTAQAQGRMQSNGFSKEAFDAAKNPAIDHDSLNRMLMVIDGKPQALTKVEGNAIVNPMVAPTSQDIRMTDLGQAMIGTQGTASTANLARANASNAAAGNSRAMAALHGGQLDKVRGMPAGALTEAMATDLNAQATDMLNNQGIPQAQVDSWIQGEYAKHGASMPGAAPRTGPDPNEKRSSLTQREIDASFKTDKGKFDTPGYRRFMEFMRVHDYKNAQHALIDFGTDMSNVVGGVTVAKPAVVAAPSGPGLLDRAGTAVSGAGSAIADALGMGDAPAAPRGPSAPVNPAGQKTAADAVRPASKAEFDALAPGTLFVNPADGQLMRKKG